MNDAELILLFFILLLAACLFPCYLHAINSFISKHELSKQEQLNQQELQFIKSLQLAKKEREFKNYEAVRKTSERYKKVIELNLSTVCNENILDDGDTVTYLFVDKKSQFDNLDPTNRIRQYLTENKEEILKAIRLSQENAKIYQEYENRFSALQSNASVSMCSILGIPFDEYIQIEEKLVEQEKLEIVKKYSITFRAEYISPQGRKRYSTDYVYNERDIEHEFKQIEEDKRYRSSEKYRRSEERSKVTPSVRYDVMRRDGFRCCLCGRSADSGVELEVDHITPISKGGRSEMDNLQTLCRDCNRGKGAKY